METFSGSFRLSKENRPPSTPLSNSVSFSSSFNQSSARQPLGNLYSASPSATTGKRKRAAENSSLGDSTPSSKKRAYTPRKSTQDKLDEVFQLLKKLNWTLGELLFHIFSWKEGQEERCKRKRSHRAGVRGMDAQPGEGSSSTSRPRAKDLSRSAAHSTYATKFLQGHNIYTPAMIIDLWFRSPDGRIIGESPRSAALYSLDQDYMTIKPSRAALGAFAVQVVQKRLGFEARQAVLPSSGLHATSKKRGSQKIDWSDVGKATLAHVERVIQEHQPVTLGLMLKIAGATEEGSRLRRPAHAVCYHAISNLNFTRNNEARLLPLARGLLAFASSAPVDLISYASRVGEMPAYSTISNTLEKLADHDAEETRKHAQDTTTCGFIQADNTQNYLQQRDQRIGRANKMNIGIAATYCELPDVDVKAVNSNDRRQRVLENKRSQLTVEQLVGWIDNEHLDTIFSLHWLRVLIHSIPELASLKTHLNIWFKTKGSKLQLPVAATKVHPLASSGKNETITTELKDALVDFFAQLGHTESHHDDRFLFVGGDGLTFQKILELKKYLQFHPDSFESMDIVEPSLSLWHTEWTDLSRVFEVHWDKALSLDPSSLGHSAAQINRRTPPNLKKVDYYPAADFMYLVLETRMLDCWSNHFKTKNIFAHFKSLSEKQSLPPIEDLLRTAQSLHRAFSSTRAIYFALDDVTSDSEWAQTIPLGSSWAASTSLPTTATTPDAPPAGQPSTTAEAQGKAKTKKREKKAPPPTRHKNGDRVLANTITFMRDGLISREMAYASAQGDVGRVYEILKVLLFTFTGSSHTKYTTYLLEFLTRLELESSPELREAILRTTLVNLTGREGAFSAADLMQEFFNRLLEAIVDKKGVEYGDHFIRNVISRNLHHFARIKLDLRVGVGLAGRSGRHTEPHLNPEVRALLEAYQSTELHYRRPGRVYSDVDKDQLQAGILKLSNGKLRKWVADTTSTRNLLSRLPTEPAEEPVSDSSDDSDEAEDEDKNGDAITGEPVHIAIGQIIDGEYVLTSMDDLDVDVDKWMARFDEEATVQAEAEVGDLSTDSEDEAMSTC